MRHRMANRKLGRDKDHRRALFKNMATALFTYEKIITTEAKAKAVRRIVEKLITMGKRGDLAARRRVSQLITNKKVVKKLFDQIAPRFSNRNGGYTRILKIGRRVGDNAPLVLMGLIGAEPMHPKHKKEERAASKAAAKESSPTAPPASTSSAT